jgi:lipopolysaccharide/colanic/teichoic acid biosynthesis glycosyltransferase
MKTPFSPISPVNPHAQSPPGTARNETVFDQDPFLRLLCLERKRTQRSGRPFVLMLLRADTLLKAGKDRHTLDRVFKALAHATRETDVKGWYTASNTIGVIFTEINGAPRKAVAGALLSRITTALGSTLAIEEINEVRISFHIFPEEPSGDGDTPVDPYLYPDLYPDIDAKKGDRILKRSIDIAGSLGLLILSAPVLLAVAVAIKLTSKGPVLFRQKRVGQYGRQFTFLKFRSMHVSNDESVHKEYMQSLIAGKNCGQAAANGLVFKMTKDSRITPIGKFLRKTSLDEFPQFINVLKGEMSLVGPRPAIPYEVKYYDIWHRERLLAVKPGITGLWQVTGRSRIKFADMVRLDLQYAKSWTPWLDIKILIKTPRAVILGDGAV